jgi:hypothetical protein
MRPGTARVVAKTSKIRHAKTGSRRPGNGKKTGKPMVRIGNRTGKNMATTGQRNITTAVTTGERSILGVQAWPWLGQSR